MSELKLCKDCRYFAPNVLIGPSSSMDLCVHPSLITIDPVRGDRVYRNDLYSARPRVMRGIGKCGMDAELLEAAPPPPPKEPPCSIEIPGGQVRTSAGFWGFVNAIFTKKSKGAV